MDETKEILTCNEQSETAIKDEAVKFSLNQSFSSSQSNSIEDININSANTTSSNNVVATSPKVESNDQNEK